MLHARHRNRVIWGDGVLGVGGTLFLLDFLRWPLDPWEVVWGAGLCASWACRAGS